MEQSFFVQNVNIVQECLSKLFHEYKIVVNENNILTTNCQDLRQALDLEISTHAACKESLALYIKNNETLTKKIELLEADRQEFAKVSHIIALEKENAKLKLELSKLELHKAKATSEKTKTNNKEDVMDKPKQVVSVSSEKIEAPLIDNASNQATSVVEKKNESEKTESGDALDHSHDVIIPQPNENTNEVVTKETDNNGDNTQGGTTEDEEEEEDVKEKKIKGTIYYVGLKTNKIYEKTSSGDIGNELGYIKKDGQKSVVVWND